MDVQWVVLTSSIIISNDSKQYEIVVEGKAWVGF